MQTYILTSAFDQGFTPDFTKVIKERLNERETFVFIASSFDQPQKNQKYAGRIIEMFNEIGIEFKTMIIIDKDTPKKKVNQIIDSASLIWISGGDTLKQIGYLREYQLDEILKNYQGIVIGMSAGSINMACRVVLAKDIEDNIPELSVYEGLGLVNINIEPHLDLLRGEHLLAIKEAGKIAPIYCLYDDSFILIEQNQQQIFGPYVLFDTKVN